MERHPQEPRATMRVLAEERLQRIVALEKECRYLREQYARLEQAYHALLASPHREDRVSVAQRGQPAARPFPGTTHGKDKGDAV